MTVMIPLLLIGMAARWVWGRFRSRRAAESFTDAEAEAIVRQVFEDRRRCLEESTREHDFVDPRKARQIHSKTAAELAAERSTEDSDEWKWARIQQELSCDGDFMAIATRLDSQFPTT